MDVIPFAKSKWGTRVTVVIPQTVVQDVEMGVWYFQRFVTMVLLIIHVVLPLDVKVIVLGLTLAIVVLEETQIIPQLVVLSVEIVKK